MNRFQVYKDSSEQWRWRMVAKNNRIIADSSEGYTLRKDAIRAIMNLCILIEHKDYVTRILEN